MMSMMTTVTVMERTMTMTIMMTVKTIFNVVVVVMMAIRRC